MQRREFVINEISINGLKIKRVIVDEHAYKHSDVTDDLILDLVRQLDGVEQRPDDVKDTYEYFTSLLEVHSKKYRLVWLLEQGQLYLGIITAYRDKRSK